MQRILLSFSGSILIFMMMYGVGNLLSHYLPWGQILLTAAVSVVLNSLIVRVVIQSGTFYKGVLYPMCLYNVLFVLIPGIILIVTSEKSYVMDAMDVISPYVTLTVLSLIHGGVLMLVVRINKRLV
ncbi:hypothetical protein CN378_17415 [Bacillus sp. AFS015802]|uniref:hypothetical protein n=1 Tax=Bacillus sp. AFS015802 TaxID=2033486 RepID=UPI000BF63F89|nr:hypothetical protein [Bacillus sp. AFS015802]PFA62823.1 hypothetical protein CN378_17415 [Bacillus sp. AFS015802]